MSVVSATIDLSNKQPLRRKIKMARSLAVKVPTASLVALVEEKIATIKAQVATYPADVKQYEADLSAYRKSLVALTIKALTENPELIGDNYDNPIRVSVNGYSNSVDVRIDSTALGFPESPKKPEDPNSARHYGRDYAKPLEMLEKTLRVLKMTQQEEVPASTYSSVMDLL
jgi:hypothetical protein